MTTWWTRDAVGHFIDAWGVVVLASAFVLEMVLVIERALAARYGGERWPTISMAFRDDGKQWLALPFGWGLLAGHWWGPLPQLFSWDYWFWIATAAALLTRDIANRWHPTPLSKRWTFAALALGVIEGVFFWSTGS